MRTLTLKPVQLGSGAIAQTGQVDLGNNHYIDINVTLLNKEQASLSKNMLLEDALESEKKRKTKDEFKPEEQGGSEVALSGGEKAAIHVLYSPIIAKKFNVCVFMPDNSTVVTVEFSLDKYRKESLFKTLKI